METHVTQFYFACTYFIFCILQRTNAGDGAGDFAQLMESMVGGAGNTGNRGGYAGAAGGSPFPQDFDFGSFAEAMQKGDLSFVPVCSMYTGVEFSEGSIEISC